MLCYQPGDIVCANIPPKALTKWRCDTRSRDLFLSSFRRRRMNSSFIREVLSLSADCTNIEAISASQTVLIGDKATVTCTAVASATSSQETYWSRDSTGSPRLGTGTNLTVATVLEDDAGSYYCFIEDRGCTSSKETSLSVFWGELSRDWTGQYLHDVLFLPPINVKLQSHSHYSLRATSSFLEILFRREGLRRIPSALMLKRTMNHADCHLQVKDKLKRNFKL